MKTFASGAKSSEAAPRLDLVPLAALLRLAARMALGATSHGARNYERGVDDPAFIMDRRNHLVLHCVQYASGDQTDDHLGAILANAAMLARLEEMAAVPEREDVSEKRIHFSVMTPNGNTPEQATYASVEDATGYSAPTYDEKRAAAQPCLGGCGMLIQNAQTCQPCRTHSPRNPT